MVTVPWSDLPGMLAVFLGGMYGWDKAVDRVSRRRTAASDVVDLVAEPGRDPGQSSGPPLLSRILASPPVIRPLPPTAQPDPAEAGEAEEPTDALEILAESPGPVAGRVLAATKNLVAKTRRVSDGHRSLQLAATVGVCLFLACLALVLVIPLLLVAALGYVRDSRHDIRLRIIGAIVNTCG
jgi:hypothetical protein